MNTAVSPAHLKQRIRRIFELPSLPESQQILFGVLNDADLNARDLATAIETCPEIAARILGLARSAYFAQPIPCRSIHDAIVRILGFRLVKNVVIGLIMSSTFSGKSCPGFDSRRFWGGSVITAILARLLSEVSTHSQRPHPDECYLCGLLQNIGMLVLVHLSPAEMSEVFALRRERPERFLSEVEIEVLGIDHARAGAILAARWNLPPDVCAVIEGHDVAEYRGPHWPSHMIVAASRHVADLITLDLNVDEMQLPPLTQLEISEQQFGNVVATVMPKVEEILDFAKVFA